MATASVESSTRVRIPRPVIYTDLYDLIEAVQDAIEPGEEACVTPIVSHILRQGQARWLRHVDVTAIEAAARAREPLAGACEVLV